MKGLSMRIKCEHKVGNMYNGSNVAWLIGTWLIDWGWLVQLQLQVQINWPSFPGFDALRNTTGQLKKKNQILTTGFCQDRRRKNVKSSGMIIHEQYWNSLRIGLWK